MVEGKDVVVVGSVPRLISTAYKPVTILNITCSAVNNGRELYRKVTAITAQFEPVVHHHTRYLLRREPVVGLYLSENDALVREGVI